MVLVEAGEGFAIIRRRYLLLTFIPCYVDEKSEIWLEQSWHRDFVRHTEYLHDLTLLAPRLEYRNSVQGLVRVDQSAIPGKLQFVGLKSQQSRLRALSSIPHTLFTLWREIRTAEIVHSGIIGWPYPLGWIANPIALLYKRSLVLFVESAPWRNARRGVIHRIMSWLTECLGRYFMNRATLAVVTQPSYLESLRPNPRRGSEFVNPASWIDEGEILDDNAVIDSWETKFTSPPRFLFAGRLEPDKGVAVLLEAVDRLEAAGQNIRIDVIGDGSLYTRCAEYAMTPRESVHFRLLDSVPYGAPFFRLLQDYQAVLVPSLGDEQPRILFDAFSQGIPVIASDTDGIRPYVNDGGWLTVPGSVDSLVESLVFASESVDELRARGLSAHAVSKTMTHREMHRKRSHVLAML